MQIRFTKNEYDGTIFIRLPDFQYVPAAMRHCFILKVIMYHGKTLFQFQFIFMNTLQIH